MRRIGNLKIFATARNRQSVRAIDAADPRVSARTGSRGSGAARDRRRTLRQTATMRTFLWSAVVVSMVVRSAAGGAFSAYELTGSFDLPIGAGVFDVLPDGRIVTVAGPTVLVEIAAGSHTFEPVGSLPAPDFSDFGPSFLRVSPDGATIAIGNGGGATFVNYQVGVFQMSDLAGGWFAAPHFDGAWIDGTNLALTAGDFGEPAFVSVLDTSSPNPGDPSNTVVIENIGGASAGIAFDDSGRLYTGNGFATSGPSGTGAVKAFDQKLWSDALDGGETVDFENDGVLIVDVLSATSLGFDGEGNLHVGGGDFAEDEIDFAALINATAITDALFGLGPADLADPMEVRFFDPDETNAFNFYDLNTNPLLEELYIREGLTVYVFAVPEPGTLVLVCAIGTVLLKRSRRGAAGTRCGRGVSRRGVSGGAA